MIRQSDVWWADLGAPTGASPGFRRPVVIIQGEAFNQSRIGSVVCVALTSNLKWVDAPGNVRLTARETGLPKDSVANVSQIVTLDRSDLSERAGALATSRTNLHPVRDRCGPGSLIRVGQREPLECRPRPT